MLFLKLKINTKNIFSQGCNKMIFCVTNLIAVETLTLLLVYNLVRQLNF